ncbi:MAG: hypothetical protein LAN84_12840 [Acidobacteriia bacterium]|nr:hypothetical protein [Terriglobia bacterium]
MKRACLLALLGMLLAGSGAVAEKKKAGVVLAPRLAPGQVLRYQLAFHSTSKSRTESVIVDPEPAADAELSLGIGLRVEVLDVQPAAGGSAARPALRLRVTYERVAATQRPDDAATSPGGANDGPRGAAALEGQAFDCTLDGSGAAECSGAEKPVPGAAEELRGWLAQIFGGRGIPQKGIAPGERWGDEREVGGAIPLAGLRWVRQFTYVDNEPCQLAAAGAAGKASAAAETCAVIRARSLLIRKGGRKDVTPEAFREKGLRTAGTASGVSESLTRISLASGLLLSASESGWQSSDVTVSTADGARKIHTTTELKTDSGLTLVRDAP